MASSLKDTFNSKGYEYPKVTPLYFYDVQLKRSGDDLDQEQRAAEFNLHLQAVKQLQNHNMNEFPKILPHRENSAEPLRILCTEEIAEKLSGLTAHVDAIFNGLTGLKVNPAQKAKKVEITLN